MHHFLSTELVVHIFFNVFSLFLFSYLCLYFYCFAFFLGWTSSSSSILTTFAAILYCSNASWRWPVLLCATVSLIFSLLTTFQRLKENREGDKEWLHAQYMDMKKKTRQKHFNKCIWNKEIPETRIFILQFMFFIAKY